MSIFLKLTLKFCYNAYFFSILGTCNLRYLRTLLKILIRFFMVFIIMGTFKKSVIKPIIICALNPHLNIYVVKVIFFIGF